MKMVNRIFWFIVSALLLLSQAVEANLKFPVRLKNHLGETVAFDIIVEIDHEVIDHEVGTPSKVRIEFVDKEGRPFYLSRVLEESQISLTAKQFYRRLYGFEEKHWRAVSISCPLEAQKHSFEIDLDSFFNEANPNANLSRSAYASEGGLRDVKNLHDENAGLDLFIRTFEKDIRVTLNIAFGARDDSYVLSQNLFHMVGLPPSQP